MKKLLTIALILTLGLSLRTYAQDESSTPELSISGSVDAYFRSNLNASNSLQVDNGVYIAPGSSFANQPGFALGMANVVLGLQGEKTGFVADLVFGPRGTDAVFGSTTASSSIVNQLYAYWNVSDGTTLTFGNFNTFLGYEVISPTANYNYSTSYMFSYGPFSHSGLKADFTLSEDASLMLAIMNPTDATDFNPSADYVLGAQLGYSGGYLNFIYDGANDFYQIDFTGGWDLSDTFYLGVNATKAKDNFTGAALYLQNAMSDSFSMGLRGEYFKDDGIGLFTEGENVIDLTLSANYSVGNLTIIPEFRIDMLSSDEFITGGDQTVDSFGFPNGINNTEMSKSLSSFVLAAVYSF
ncbi:MAG: outer membrane beta-barrel protein [Cyclobacteriaceae bacterium]